MKMQELDPEGDGGMLQKFFEASVMTWECSDHTEETKVTDYFFNFCPSAQWGTGSSCKQSQTTALDLGGCRQDLCPVGAPETPYSSLRALQAALREHGTRAPKRVRVRPGPGGAAREAAPAR